MKEDRQLMNRVYHMSQDEVAKAMGITRSQVDSIEKLALRKFRRMLRLKKFKLKDFF